MQKLSEKTRFCPSILTHNGKYVAWTGLDNSLNVGIVYGSSPQLATKYHFAEQSLTSPCLASHNSQVFIAWTSFTRQINLAVISGSQLREHCILQETETQDPPCITSHQGKLWITWRDYNSPNRINVGLVEDHNITNHIVYATESTAFAPSMVSFKDKLFLAWVSDDTKINIGEVAEHQLENKVKTIETSYETPWLSVENNELKLAWIGIDVGHHLNIATFENGRLTTKKTVKVPLTEEIAIIHRGHPTMHSFHRGIKIYREGHTGIRYANGTFAYSINSSLPEPAPTNPLDKQKYDEYASSLHNIILYKA